MNVVIFSWMRLQWLCCGEVVSCVVVGDQYSVALKGDNYTIYCLPHCRPSVTCPAFSLPSTTELQCHLSCLSELIMSTIQFFFLILLSGQKENRPRVECRPAWTLLAPLRVYSQRPHQEKSPQPPLPHTSKPSCLWKQPSVSRCTSQSRSCCWLTPILTLTEPWQGRGFPSSQHLIGRIVRQKHLRWRCHLHPLLVREEEEHWMQSGKVD